MAARPGQAEPPLRLTDVRYDPDTGDMRYPHHLERAPESVLAGYLEQAERLAGERRDSDCSTPPHGLRGDFEHLRWFELPPECLVTGGDPAG